jgi:hypothetical protein
MSPSHPLQILSSKKPLIVSALALLTKEEDACLWQKLLELS